MEKSGGKNKNLGLTSAKKKYKMVVYIRSYIIQNKNILKG